MSLRVLRSVSGVLVTASFLGSPVAKAQGVVLHANQVYATVPVQTGTKDLRLDIYEPTLAPTPRPLVLWIHGGGWSGGTEDNPPAQFLAEQGYVVASVQYRLSGEAKWPAQIQDVKGAVRWLRANAATFGIDVDRIGAWGSSAGGHLTAFLAATGEVGVVTLGGTTIDLEGTTGGNLAFSSRIQAAVDWFGPTDFVAMDSFPSTIDHDAVNSPESSLLGEDIDTVLMEVASADPRTFVSLDDPPLLIQHGTADPAVPYSQSERLYEMARYAFGLDCRFVPVPDGLHGGPGFDPQLAQSFFDEHLKGAILTTLTLSTVGATSEESGASSAAFRITRSGSTTNALDVRIAARGTATEGSDFAPLGTLVRVPAGQASLDLPVTALADSLVEGAESVELFLRASPGVRIPAGSEHASIAISDDEDGSGLPIVTVTAVDAVASETSGNPARFTFTRSGALTAPLTIDVLWSGRAVLGADYVPLPSNVVFPAGQASVDRILTPIDDTRIETAESVVVEVLAGTTYALGSAKSADIRIDDNETSTLPQVTIAVEDDRLEESNALSHAFLLSRLGATTSPLTVAIGFGGDASIGGDFIPFGNQVTFAVGEAHHRIEIDPVDDPAVEGDEDLIVTLLPNAAYRVGLVQQAKVRIVDNDDPTPQSAVVSMSASALRAGDPFTLSVLGPTPNQPFALFLSTLQGFAPAPASGFPLLLDASTLIVLGPFVLDGNAGSTLVFPLPAVLPDLGVNELFLQAAVATTSSFALSPRIDRRIHPTGP